MRRRASSVCITRRVISNARKYSTSVPQFSPRCIADRRASGSPAGSSTLWRSASSRMVESRSDPSRWTCRSVLGSFSMRDRERAAGSRARSMRKYTTRTAPGDVLARVLRRETSVLIFAAANACSCSAARQKAEAVQTANKTEAREFAEGGTPGHPASWPASWPFAQGTKDTESRRGTIVTDAAIATRIGAGVLAGGGNAVDAAVAAAFALAVAYPTAGNIRGGGFAVARINGESRALDFRETAP